MFTRLSFTQAVGQLLAVTIDWVVGLLTPRRRSPEMRPVASSRVSAPKQDDKRSTSPVQSPEAPQKHHSVA